MQTNGAGIDLIKRFEGLSLTTYNDAAGLPTIGYGHLLKPGEAFPGGITEAKAEELLRADLAEAEQAVTELVKVPLTDNQFAALVSFTFNLGGVRLKKSTLLKKLNAGDYTGAAAQFGRWVHAGKPARKLRGLVARRAEEAAMFGGGVGDEAEDSAGLREQMAELVRDWRLMGERFEQLLAEIDNRLTNLEERGPEG